MGAIYARVAGTNNAATGMPSNVLVLPEAVSPGLKLGGNFETGALPTLTAPGELGPSYAAFNPTGGGQLQSNMELKIPRDRLNDRKYLLGRLDDIHRQYDATGAIEGSTSISSRPSTSSSAASLRPSISPRKAPKRLPATTRAISFPTTTWGAGST